MARLRNPATTPPRSISAPPAQATTRLDLAQDRPLTDTPAPTLSPAADRLLEALLWTATLAMLHLTFDVLVHHQYGTEIAWPSLWTRAARAWLVFLFLFYLLHPHHSRPLLLPGLGLRHQHALPRALFFAASVASGCRLVYISNTYGYLATMKQAPPLGCLWVWAVVELDLLAALLSLGLVAVFRFRRAYDVK